MNFRQLSAMPEIPLSNKTFNSEELEKLRYDQKYQYTISRKIPTDSFFGRLLFNILEFIKDLSPNSKTLNVLFLVIIISILIISILTIVLKAKYSTGQPANQNIDAFNEKIGIPLQSSSEEMLNKALSEQDYRSAFRWQFIIYLKKAHFAGYIILSPEKTNYDYIKEYKHKLGIISFQKACSIYDHIWYGNKMVDEKKYMSLNSLFILSNDEVKY